jgi:phosphatidylglycerol lysyltransferase
MNILLIKYGYFVLFFGVAIEGEAFLLAAGFLAHQGYLHLWLVILLAVVSNCAADQVYYLIARSRGRQWLDRRFGQNSRYPKAITLMSRHSDWLLLVSRFAFGFRIIIPAACGALGMPPLRFSLINLIAGTIWAVPVGLLGFHFGTAADRVLGDAKSYELWILLIVLAGGAGVLLIRHLRRVEWVEDLKWSDLHLLVPSLIWLMGAINLISAIWPRSHVAMKALETWLPLEVTQRSRPPMMFAGLALMQVTRSLARRKELAWFVAVIALSVSIALHITRAFDLHHSLVAGLLLAYLIYFRRRYFAASDPASLKWAALMAPILFGAVFVYGVIGLTHLHGQYSWNGGNTPVVEAFNSGVLIREPLLDPNTPRAAHFLGSVQIAGWLARLYLLILLVRPVILRTRQDVPDEVAQRIFKSHGRYSLSSFAIQSDKHHVLVADGLGLIGYATRGSVALACGDPLAPDSLLYECIKQYAAFCQRNGWTPCVYEAAEARLPLYHGMGYRTLKIAEEAMIDLNQFSLSGGKMSNLRAMVNKAAKAGMVVTRYHRQQEMNPQIDEQLEAISEEWLSEKHLGEMGFTMGRFSLEGLVEIPVFIASVNERVEAFCSWLPFQSDNAAVLDLMRKRKDAPAGTMDILLAHSLLRLKDDKLREASLANAPLANTSAPHGQLERGVALLFEKMNFLYGYKNLFQFKKKFAPRWEGRYLVYPKGTDIPAIAYALTGVHASGSLLQLLIRR